MFEELATVVLNRDILEQGLIAGDVGAIVHKYHDGSGFEVEFVAGNGRTVVLVTLTAADFRTMEEHDILHVRKLAA
uniref:DUF4926 domain-containing protein n=1 Tax=Candidatus Kentrum sp. DK TaxID=2126562 RepID=A0A450S3K2_9GAMM|nr:MAG: protein of unknown function (DUF4926) [Candidatus Kentron sp. DK]